MGSVFQRMAIESGFADLVRPSLTKPALRRQVHLYISTVNFSAAVTLWPLLCVVLLHAISFTLALECGLFSILM